MNFCLKKIRIKNFKKKLFCFCENWNLIKYNCKKKKKILIKKKKET